MTATGRSTGETRQYRATRDRLLDAAERRALDVGIGRLRVGQIAADAGVSRQTVYNEFGDKWGVARAIAVRIADRLLDGIEAEMLAHVTPARAVASGVAYCLRAATAQPLIRIALNREKGDDMLALLSTDLGEVIELAHRRMVRVGERLWPDLSEQDRELGAELAVRITLSHIVCPTESVEESAAKVAQLVDGFLRSRASAP